MTEVEALELGREAVGCAAWSPRPGMWYGRVIRGPGLSMFAADLIVVSHPDDHDPGMAVHAISLRAGEGRITLPADALPHFGVSATVGGLLALVREAWGDPCITVAISPGFDNIPDEWACLGRGGRRVSERCATEPHALVSALRAAPVATR